MDTRAGGTGYDIWVNVLANPYSEPMPSDFILYQNYPNPIVVSNGSSRGGKSFTYIGFNISKPGLVTLKIYDLLGREITTIVNENRPTGQYIEIYNIKNLPSGIYFYRIRVGDFVVTKKFILQR